MRTAQIRYRGANLQGVGLRKTIALLANDYEISGYIANLQYGAIEIIAQGDSDNVLKFWHAINQSLESYPNNISIIELYDVPKFNSFEIK